HYYAAVYLPALSAVVEPVDPWSLTDPDEIARAAAEDRHGAMALEIGRRNIAAIRSSRLLAANLDGQEVDSGTAAEIGYAAALGIRCFGLRSDLRQAGEHGVPVNLQVAALVEHSGGRIAGSLTEL